MNCFSVVFLEIHCLLHDDFDLGKPFLLFQLYFSLSFSFICYMVFNRIPESGWQVMRGLFAAAVFFFACKTNARTPEPKPTVRVMDSTEMSRYRDLLASFFDSLLNQNGFSGGILVAKNGQVLYEHYQGDTYGNQAVPIGSNTPFHVASTSKTFTSTAILQLEEKKLLSLNDLVKQHWPEFPYDSVTIRHLLNHSSGIPDYAYFLPKYHWDTKIAVANWDVLQMINEKKPDLVFKTGTRFKYCNTNFVLLALLVEKVTGLTFPYYVQENIFKVAGMNSSYILTTLNRGDYMPSWAGNGRIYNYEYLDGLYGDKNVFSTCRDLMKYDEAIRDGKLLNPDSYEKAWQAYFKDGKYSDSWEYYGLGWRLKIFENGLKIPYHNGWWHGNNAVFQRLVADTAVIIVTGNRMNSRIYASAKAANFFRGYFPGNPVTLYSEEAAYSTKENTSSTNQNQGGDNMPSNRPNPDGATQQVQNPPKGNQKLPKPGS